MTADLRDGFRALRATPVISAVAILSLAPGIGANTALFSAMLSGFFGGLALLLAGIGPTASWRTR